MEPSTVRDSRQKTDLPSSPDMWPATHVSYLIYIPTSIGECDDENTSDTSQTQKWTYLQSVAHLGTFSFNLATDLITRTQEGTIVAPTRYCSSLLEWETNGVHLSSNNSHFGPLYINYHSCTEYRPGHHNIHWWFLWTGGNSVSRGTHGVQNEPGATEIYPSPTDTRIADQSWH